ncbi:hypothetical protein SO802_017569 [Lithocarpus litseifolius]|uniref:Uncharacterized protein n=1 Tax=Lithocarpus litseifolius TaxID=425828 RepID=A0AAW2CIB6_9ROSI
MISSPVVDSMSATTIDVLLDSETRQWRNDMSNGLLVPQEADFIRSIPLACVDAEDTLYWPLTQDWEYTYKSRYYFLKEDTELVPQQTPSS